MISILGVFFIFILWSLSGSKEGYAIVSEKWSKAIFTGYDWDCFFKKAQAVTAATLPTNKMSKSERSRIAYWDYISKNVFKYIIAMNLKLNHYLIIQSIPRNLA